MHFKPSLKWDKFFLGLALHASTISKDPSTKTGAVIVRPDRTVASIGFNGFPKNMPDKLGYYADREEKYARIVHCEMNAVLHAREPVAGYTLYTWPFASCDRCAVHMLQAGIERFVFPKPSADALSRWAESLERTKLYFKEAGVEFLQIDSELVFDKLHSIAGV